MAGARQPRAVLAAVAACAIWASLAAQALLLPNHPDSVKFAAIGDMGTGDRPQYQVAEEMVRRRAEFGYDFVIMLGDNMYGRQRPQDFVLKFERPYQALLDGGVKFYASLGNHDEQTNRNYKLWNMNGERYYTFTKKNVRFFALDSDYLDPKQLAWLEAQLKGATERWKVCFFHHPLYSSADAHGSQVDLRTVLEPLLVKYGVNVVFNGHDHVYERLNPQQGIYYFVSGAGGKLRRGDLRKTPLTAAGHDQDQSFMLVEIADEVMSFAAITRGGKIVDSGSLPRQKPAPPAPQPAKPDATPASRQSAP